MLHADVHEDDVATGGLNVVANFPPHTEPVTESPLPQSAATQSAVYEAPGEDGRPIYRGFQDPKMQSQTFKKLQSLIESGEGKKSEPIRLWLKRFCIVQNSWKEYGPVIGTEMVHFQFVSKVL